MLGGAIAGFFEGLLAPIGELEFALLFSAGLAIIQTVGNPVASFAFSLVGLITIEDLARNVLVGLSPSEFALGSLVGNIIGIALFYNVLDSISHEAALESALLVLALIASIVVGCIVASYRFFSK